ncbi:MAG: hypothetical protein LBQ15_02955 [Clostridium sp.]|jgi:hypothetical protein|nr:hypothetical protein [Clostridium sp.]
MGYQESLVLVRPHQHLHSIVADCENKRQSGCYEQNPCSIELRSVAVLKRRIHTSPAGTKLLWVTGGRYFHNRAGLLGKPLGDSRLKLLFLSAESLFGQKHTDGIDFPDSIRLSENSWIKRYTPQEFLAAVRPYTGRPRGVIDGPSKYP